jgi:hypothetical protein
MMKAFGKTGIILVLSLLLTCTTVFAAEDFSYWDSQSRYPSDIMNTKYQSSVKALIDAGVIEGDTDGLFHPEKSINRAEFASIVAKATHQQNMEAGTNYFTDLVGYGWATAYINRCYEQNWIRGVGEKKFAPEKEVSYAEAMTILIRIQRGGQREELLGKWPDVYIEYAATYNLVGNMDILNWNAPAQKGDIAILTNRMIKQPDLIQTNRGASFSNAVINGTVGIPVVPQSINIDLHNDMFLNISANTNITNWFSDLASLGLSATLKTNVSEGMNLILVEITGTPNKASQTQLSAYIPSNYLKSANSVSVSSGNAARFNIVEGS